MGCIYIITNTINNKVYIGQTLGSPIVRINKHLSGKSDCPYINNAAKKYGRENFIWEVVEKSNFKDVLNVLEKKYIDKYASNQKEYGYNIECGAKSYHRSETTKIKLSEQSKKQFSDPQQREIQRENKIKYFKNDENKIKISRAKGIKPFFAFKDNEEIIEFECMTLAAEKLGIKCNHISDVLMGNRKTSGGWRFSYQKPEDYTNKWTFYAEKCGQILKFDDKNEAAKQLSCNPSVIRAILAKEPNRKTSNGWRFSYSIDDLGG